MPGLRHGLAHRQGMVAERKEKEAMDELSPQQLDDELKAAENCESATISGARLKALLDTAVRSRHFAISKLDHLKALGPDGQVTLKGSEFRLLLLLALRVRRADSGEEETSIDHADIPQRKWSSDANL
jgi:hypothetical protein